MNIGKLFDIPIKLHWSWLIGFVLITWLVASGGLPFIPVGLAESQRWVVGAIITMTLFVSVLAHELAHSLTAKRLGYGVASITLLIFGGVSLIVDRRMKASHDFLISAAGPAASLAIGIFFIALWMTYNDPARTGTEAILEGVLFYIGLENIALAVFNMLPGLPLDGGRVLQSIVWALTGKRRFAARTAGRAGQLLSFLLTAAALYLIFIRNDLSSGVWLAFIALFIGSASSAEVRNSRSNPSSNGIAADPTHTVRHAMTSVSMPINAAAPLEQAVQNVISRHPEVDLPVISSGRITGLVSMDDVNALRLDQNEGRGLTVSDIARRVRTFAVEPDTDLNSARRILTRGSTDLLLVFEDDYLIGMCTLGDIERASISL